MRINSESSKLNSMSRIPMSLLVVCIVFAYVSAEQYHRLRCEPNAEPRPCGKDCEPTCEKPQKIFCTPANKDSCKYECRCKDGYVRHNGQCIKVEDCPKECEYGEILAACGRTCEGTCKSPTLPEICLMIKCAKQECRCDLDGGFVRDEKTNKCVRKEKCPC